MNQQYEVEARQVVKGFIFLFVGLAMLLTAIFSLLSLSGGKIVVKSNGRGLLGTAEASIPKVESKAVSLEMGKVALVDSAKNEPLVLVQNSAVNKTVLEKDSLSTQSSKKKKSTFISLGQKKWIIKEKWGWFLEICCREEGLPEECVDTLISLSAHESGGHPGIKNDSSSATGLFQFITSTGRSVAQELGIDPRLYNPKDPYQNIRLGVRYFAKNRRVHNSSLWGILSHYTGTYGASDEAIAYGGIDNTPFVKAVKASIATPYEEPQQWAIAKWKSY